MISVDRVYQTVQKILNKEQRGYFPPVEFNLFANMAQIEIFENYFYDLDVYMEGGMNDSDYADIVTNIEEKILVFESSYESMENSDDIHTYPNNFYRLGKVFLNGKVVDEMSKKDASYVNLSPLTAPTRSQPIFAKDGNGFRLYPLTLLDTDSVEVYYTRRPVDVEWGYMNVNGRAVYSANRSTDFELHASELPLLVLKICNLAGVAIRAIDVAQIMQSEEAGYTAELKQ